nr:putative ribonuclease h protein [Quercus suber]
MEEPTKEKLVQGGLSKSPIHKPHDMRSNYGQKGKAIKGQAKSTFGQKGKTNKGQARDSALSKHYASSSKNPFDTDTTNSSFITSPMNFTDRSFKFTSEPIIEERGYQSTQQVQIGLVQSHPNKSLENHPSIIGEQCKGGNTITVRIGVAINGANLEEVQVREERENCDSMEECATAFVGANLRQIQPRSNSNEREDEGMQLKGDDDGGNPAVGYSDAGERHLQGEDATVQMELEGDGLALGNPGTAGGGGILRSDYGVWIQDFSRSIGKTTSFLAELWALRDGLIMCLNLRISALEVEIDAQAIVELMNNDKPPMLLTHPLWLIVDFLFLKFRKLNLRRRPPQPSSNPIYDDSPSNDRVFFRIDNNPISVFATSDEYEEEGNSDSIFADVLEGLRQQGQGNHC